MVRILSWPHQLVLHMVLGGHRRQNGFLRWAIPISHLLKKIKQPQASWQIPPLSLRPLHHLMESTKPLGGLRPVSQNTQLRCPCAGKTPDQMGRETSVKSLSRGYTEVMDG